MSKSSLTTELTRLYELFEKGAISKEEYEGHKAHLLAEAATPTGKSEDQAETQKPESPSMQAAPSIVIQQTAIPTASAAASASSAASARNGGGCFSTVLKVIGGIVVLSVLVAMCTTGTDSNKDEKAGSQVADYTPEQLNQMLEAAKSENTVAVQQIGGVWSALNENVRAELKNQQVAWNRDKLNRCAMQSFDVQIKNQIAQLNCDTEMIQERIPELQKAEQELLPKAKAAELDNAEQVSEQSLSELKEVWSKLPSEIRGYLKEDLDDWAKAADERCSRAANSGDSTQNAIDTNNCITKAVKAKLQELNGYKI